MKKIVILAVLCCIAVAQDFSVEFAAMICDDNFNYENSTQEACKECLIDSLKPLFVHGVSKEETMAGFAKLMYNCSTHFNEQERFLKCTENTEVEAEANCVLMQIMRLKKGEVLYPNVLNTYCADYQGVTEIKDCKSCGNKALKAAEGDDWTDNAKNIEELMLEKSKIFFDSCTRFFPSQESVRDCYEDEDPVGCWMFMNEDKREGKVD